MAGSKDRSREKGSEKRKREGKFQEKEEEQGKDIFVVRGDG